MSISFCRIGERTGKFFAKLLLKWVELMIGSLQRTVKTCMKANLVKFQQKNRKLLTCERRTRRALDKISPITNLRDALQLIQDSVIKIDVKRMTN